MKRNGQPRRPKSLTVAGDRDQLIRGHARVQFERDWLDALAATPAYRNGVHRRLELGQRLYGGRSYTRPVEELLLEVEEELLDTTAWAIICSQAATSRDVRRALVRVSQLAAIAHVELTRAGVTPPDPPADLTGPA